MYLSHIFFVELLKNFDWSKSDFLLWLLGYILVIMLALITACITEKIIEQNKFVKRIKNM